MLTFLVHEFSVIFFLGQSFEIIFLVHEHNVLYQLSLPLSMMCVNNFLCLLAHSVEMTLFDYEHIVN